MDRVEQSHCFGRLVRLQPADLVQPDIGVTRQQCRPFGERLLDTVLAKVALAGGDQRLDFRRRATLADRNQLDLRRVAPGKPRRGGDLLVDAAQSFSGAAQGATAIGLSSQKSRDEAPFS
jgi:hypothetical protein